MVLIVAAVIGAVAPQISPLTAALIVTAVLSVVVTLLVWRISGFRAADFTSLRRGCDLRLLILPAALAVVPLLAGLRPVDALRIGTIWPLMVLHWLTDLFAAAGALPRIPILVGQDVVLLAVGLWLVSRRGPAPAAAAAERCPRPVPAAPGTLPASPPTRPPTGGSREAGSRSNGSARRPG